MLDKKDSKCNIEGAILKHFEEENRPYVVLFNVSDWSAKLSFPKEVPDLLIKNRCCTLRHKHALCTHIFGTCRRLRESCILLCLANLASCLKFRRPFDHTEDMWSTLKLRLGRAPCSRFEICRPLLLFSAFKLTCTTAVSYNILYLLLGHVRVDVRVKSWKIKDETKAWFVWTYFSG